MVHYSIKHKLLPKNLRQGVLNNKKVDSFLGEKVLIKLNIKEKKNAPECIVELYKHAGIFENTRKVHREARGVAESFSHFSSVLKNSQVLI